MCHLDISGLDKVIKLHLLDIQYMYTNTILLVTSNLVRVKVKTCDTPQPVNHCQSLSSLATAVVVFLNKFEEQLKIQTQINNSTKSTRYRQCNELKCCLNETMNIVKAKTCLCA